MDTFDISRPGKRKLVTTLVEELGYHEQRLQLEIAEGTDEVIIITIYRILGTNNNNCYSGNRLSKIEAAVKRKNKLIEGRMNLSKEYFFKGKNMDDWVMIGDDSPVKVVKMVIIPITITMPLLDPESSNASVSVDCLNGKLGFV